MVMSLYTKAISWFWVKWKKYAELNKYNKLWCPDSAIVFEEADVMSQKKTDQIHEFIEYWHLMKSSFQKIWETTGSIF